MAWPPEMTVESLKAQLGAIHPNQDAHMDSAITAPKPGAATPGPAPLPVPAQPPMSTTGWFLVAGAVGLGLWWYWKSD